MLLPFFKFALQRTIIGFIVSNQLSMKKTEFFISTLIKRNQFSKSVYLCSLFTIKALTDDVQDQQKSIEMIQIVFRSLQGCMLRFLKIFDYFSDSMLGKLNPIILRRLRRMEELIVNTIIWKYPIYNLWIFFNSYNGSNTSNEEIEQKTGYPVQLYKNLCNRIIAISALKFDTTLRYDNYTQAHKNCIWNLFRIILATNPEQVVQTNLITLQTCCLILGTKIFSSNQKSKYQSASSIKTVRVRLTADHNPRIIMLSFEQYFNRIFLGFNENAIQNFTHLINKHPSLSPYAKQKTTYSSNKHMEISKKIAFETIQAIRPYCCLFFDKEITLIDQLKIGRNSKYHLQYQLVERLRREVQGLNPNDRYFPIDLESTQMEYKFGDTSNSDLFQLQKYIQRKVGVPHIPEPITRKLTLLRNLEKEKNEEFRSLLVPRLSSSRGGSGGKVLRREKQK